MLATTCITGLQPAPLLISAHMLLSLLYVFVTKLRSPTADLNQEEKYE